MDYPFIDDVENYLFKNFTSIDEFQKKVYESMLYSLSSGGKRLRPILTILTFKAISDEDIAKVIPFAAAVELIHTYSLIHDDLPAMDNDDIRRGKPTNHKVYSEAMAILSGDGLLNMAAEVLSREIEKMDSIEAIQRGLHAMRYIFTCTGVHGMIGGQVIDLGYTDTMNREVCETMYKLKTAALIRGSVVSGAILAGANDTEIATFEEFANALGMAFQEQDDYIDAAQDQAHDNNTILNYITKEELSVAIEKHTNRALKALSTLSYDTSELEALTRKLVGREL
ncbi:polyprenyl synthetase family protein [Peptoniphilus equinus]|uniref:Polyprenyl synthetase family protein n=1 Tax=Peptoniphilus equinus TaxID=3016343 RepID=A0ABY7QWF0_9FIRM|nr:polyprenyl synthetase family protein [Peptoniphilus equinus]WBW50595.1 polyprenyl synthetase family protein [Peptoniphilus equinus]